MTFDGGFGVLFGNLFGPTAGGALSREWARYADLMDKYGHTEQAQNARECAAILARAGA